MPDDETLITALRSGRPEHTPEAEGVLVRHDGASVVLLLDDGDELVFSHDELLKAVA